ncbi:copper homeostasis protein CutC [Chitinophagaceae bacterium LB-8]|uniref:PF03932 family protein CutC n=1 Tax=Paraflavisolibacter caeni TaxID=2982496 RepID=A0A9X2XUK9_9BACT|nr:copper homeostasis protein CutC [Paraflavisolibacter caeni]MCU7548787.1 copper homeostasis protein CutC [Paraflavisolibacter caeni]
MDYTIEIATTDFITTESAVKGGADRIELCSAISEGGLTPSMGHIRKCREMFDLPIFPIIRPRSGDFLYTDEEFDLMMSDVKLCKELGCNGVVIGFLLNDGMIDKVRIETVVRAAYPMEVTFHRAFDRCKDPFIALEELIEAGCQRILTSGQQIKATDGLDLIKQLIEAAGDRIIIMPGSGLNPANIKYVAEATGAREFHGALRSSAESKMEFMLPSFAAIGDYINPAIKENDVREFKKALML